MITPSLLLAASLCGCSGSEVAAAAQTITSIRENPAQDTNQMVLVERSEGMEASEMQIVEIGVEDVSALAQVDLDAVNKGSGQWSVCAITDAEVLMERKAAVRYRLNNKRSLYMPTSSINI